jgi:hypothetical protein
MIDKVRFLGPARQMPDRRSKNVSSRTIASAFLVQRISQDESRSLSSNKVRILGAFRLFGMLDCLGHALNDDVWSICRRSKMPTAEIRIIVAIVFAGLLGFPACNDNDRDEQQAKATKGVASPQTSAQKPAESTNMNRKQRLLIRLLLTASVSVALVFSMLVVAGTRAVGQEKEVLLLEAHIPLPSVKGRIDHFGVDVTGRRLFVAAVENRTLEVVDLKSGQRVHTISDLAEPQGVFYDPTTSHLFVACGLDGVTKVFDGNTFQVLATVKFPDDADNIRYDPRSKGVIVGYAGAKQLRKREVGTGGLGFINSSGKKTGDIVIDAHPESFQLEQSGSRIFVNVPEKKEIEVIDADKHSVLTRWPVSAQDNFPMTLDEANQRLLIGTWNPPQLLVFDTQTGKQVAVGEIAGKTDDLFYDSLRRRVYVLTSVGYLDVFEQKDADHYNRIARYPTPSRSQTGLFVQEWGKLFVAVPAQNDHSAEIRVYQAP